MLKILGAWAQSLDNESSDLVDLDDSIFQSKEKLLAQISRIAIDKNSIIKKQSGIKAIILKNEMILEIPSETKDELNREAPVVLYGIIEKGEINKNLIFNRLNNSITKISEMDGRKIDIYVIKQAAEITLNYIRIAEEERHRKIFFKSIAVGVIALFGFLLLPAPPIFKILVPIGAGIGAKIILERRERS